MKMKNLTQKEMNDFFERIQMIYELCQKRLDFDSDEYLTSQIWDIMNSQDSNNIFSVIIQKYHEDTMVLGFRKSKRDFYSKSNFLASIHINGFDKFPIYHIDGIYYNNKRKSLEYLIRALKYDHIYKWFSYYSKEFDDFEYYEGLDRLNRMLDNWFLVTPTENRRLFKLFNYNIKRYFPNYLDQIDRFLLEHI